MTEPAPTPPPDDDPLVQVNVRIPRSLRDRIDARREQLPTDDGRPVSRDRWAARVFAHALRQPLPGAKPTQTGPNMRTAPPPHRRPTT